MYLCQGSLLTSLAVLTGSGVSRKTMWPWLSFTNAENQILKFSNTWNHWKFREILSIGQLNVIRNSGVLKTGFGQDTWKVWGLKPLSKQYGSEFAEIRSGNIRSCPQSSIYRPNQVVPHQRRSTHDNAPPLKGTPPCSCSEGGPTDKSRTSPPAAGWELARKHPLITARTTIFMLKHPLRCILRVQGYHRPFYVMVWCEVFHQGVIHLHFCKKGVKLMSECIKRNCYKELWNSLTWPSSVVRNDSSNRTQFLPKSQDDSEVAAEERSGLCQRRGLALGKSRPQPPGLKTVGCFGGYGLPKASQQPEQSEEIPPETVRAAIAKWPERLKACVEAQGGHFEWHYYK